MEIMESENMRWWMLKERKTSVFGLLLEIFKRENVFLT
jgi:hypothetical protein